MLGSGPGKVLTTAAAASDTVYSVPSVVSQPLTLTAHFLFPSMHGNQVDKTELRGTGDQFVSKAVFTGNYTFPKSGGTALIIRPFPINSPSCTTDKVTTCWSACWQKPSNGFLLPLLLPLSVAKTLTLKRRLAPILPLLESLQWLSCHSEESQSSYNHLQR